MGKTTTKLDIALDILYEKTAIRFNDPNNLLGDHPGYLTTAEVNRCIYSIEAVLGRVRPEKRCEMADARIDTVTLRQFLGFFDIKI